LCDLNLVQGVLVFPPLALQAVFNAFFELSHELFFWLYTITLIHEQLDCLLLSVFKGIFKHFFIFAWERLNLVD